MGMKKMSLKTSTNYNNVTDGLGTNRVTKTTPVEGNVSAYDPTFPVTAGSAVPKGVATNRYAKSKPGAPVAGQGRAQPLKVNATAKDDMSAIGPGVYTRSTPLRKRKAE